MKLLNITVGGTIHHVIDFDDPESYIKTFVVQNANAEPVLFSLPTMGDGNQGSHFYTQTQRGRRPLTLVAVRETDDIPPTDQYIAQTKHLFFIEENFDANQEEEALKTIKDAVEKYKKEFSDEEQKFKMHFNGQREFCCEEETPVVKYTIIFSIATINGKGQIRKKEKSFILVISTLDNIYQATIDFGSEASQVMVYNCGTDRYGVKDIMQVFQDLGITLGKENEIDTEDNKHNSKKNQKFIQFDPDIHLFRSHFFARKTFTGTETLNPVSNPLLNEHLVLMNTYNDLTQEFKQQFFTLPNVKIAALTDCGPEVRYGNRVQNVMYFQDNYFYRSAINAFIYQVLKNIAEEHKQKSTPAFLRMTILMPNVYTQAEHSKKMKHLYEDVQLMLADFKTVGGVEINSISESDASILGYITANPQFALTVPSGNYLIIDAGKGTMDLSVLKVDPDAAEQLYKSEYRTGIVGSGNAITYAVFLDLMAHRLSCLGVPAARLESTINAIVHELMLGGDEAMLAEMMRFVERFKQCWGEKPWQETPNPENGNEKDFALTRQENQLNITLQNQNTTIKLGDILEWVKSYFDPMTLSNTGSATLKEDKKPAMTYTQAMIQQLAKDVLTKFTCTHRIDYIVLSGRAFLLPQLKQAILNRLKQKNNCKKAKNIGLDNSTGINLKNLCLFVGQQLASQNYDGRVVGRPEYKKYGEDPYLYIIQGETERPRQNLGEQIAKWFKNLYTSIKAFNLFGDTYTTGMMSEKDYQEGIPITIENGKADKITINGTYYDIPNMGSNVRRGTKAVIYFNGDHFIFVCNQGAWTFSPAVQTTASHIFESTFPYGAVGEQIPFPHLSQVTVPPTPPLTDEPEEGEIDFDGINPENIETEDARQDNNENDNTKETIDLL